MRLLKRSPSGDIRLASFESDQVPRYAILSHTWTDGQEVTYLELVNGAGRNKTGFDKIRFCVDQAARDGIAYSWVDTCCIDKSTSDELGAAINSMFAWYQRAAKCYVYLSDVRVPAEVMVPAEVLDVAAFQVTWDDAFRRRGWFTRGWTLQELLAPPSVEFFSREKKRLGSKISLEKEIHQITKIPVKALRLPDVSTFSIDERMQWTTGRTTTKKEDNAYCLLGIFGVYLPLIYGEGEAHALERLREEVEKRLRASETRSLSEVAGVRKRAVYIPFLRNYQFVGRRAALETLERRLFTAPGCQTMAIVGLGGIGKTQVALSLAYWVVDQHPETSVFWVPALSVETFEQAMEEIAQRLGLKRAAGQDDAKELVKQYLSTPDAGKWLLVVDNADDINVIEHSEHSDGLLRFLPESELGITIFTTRTSRVAQHVAGNSVLKLERPTEDEASELLDKALKNRARPQDATTIKELLVELDFLPLAITQAAAYINVNEMSIAEYLTLLRSTDEDVIYIMSEEMPDHTRYKKKSASAVATTWTVSFKQISVKDPFAMELLQFMSCIEWKAIPHSILPVIEPKARMLAAVGTLCSYSFLSKRGDGTMYDMHRLVHLASRIWVRQSGRAAEVQADAVRHLVEIFPTDDYTMREIWRLYMAHVIRIRSGWTENADNPDAQWQEKSELCYWVGRCLYVDGRMKEAAQWSEEACRIRSKLAEDHPDRLASQHELAGAYQANGQTKQAIALLEHVVAIRKRVLAEDHRLRLASQHELARAYQANGQTKQAIALLEHVVAIGKSALAEDHPSRLASQHELARSYQANGQTKQAIALLEHVVGIRKRVLAEDHPSRLTSQHELARVYLANGQTKQAIALFEHVVAIRKRALAEDHPNRLGSERALANAYEAANMLQQGLAEAVDALEIGNRANS